MKYQEIRDVITKEYELSKLLNFEYLRHECTSSNDTWHKVKFLTTNDDLIEARVLTGGHFEERLEVDSKVNVGIKASKEDTASFIEALEHINKWETPDSYAGYCPTNEYGVYGVHRESTLLEQSNYELMKLRLEEKAKELGIEGSVYSWRANHCLVGWVDTLMIRADNSEDVNTMSNKDIKNGAFEYEAYEGYHHVLALANDLLEQLEGYPVLDEDNWSEKQSEAIYEYWNGLNVSDRVEYCQESGASVFAARRDNDVPNEVFYWLLDSDSFQ